jgi:hypothetical protein
MRSFIRQRPPQPAEPAPAPVYTQAQQRERRRKWLKIQYRGNFDLTAEVAAIVEPLAVQLTALPRALALRQDVDNVADFNSSWFHVIGCAPGPG